jgi:O-antigen/teichoic acid export membrane protein
MDWIKEILWILLGKKGHGSLRAQMAQGIVGTFVLKVVNVAFGFGTNLFLARLLGAKEYGVYTYAVSWAQFLAVPAVLGLNTLLTREVAKYKALKDWQSLKEIIRWSNRVVLLTSISIAVLFAMVIWSFQAKFAPEVRTTLWIAMALVPLLSFLFLRQGVLQGLGHVVEAQIPQFVIFPVTFLLLTTGLHLIFGLKGYSAVGLRCIAGFAALLFASFMLHNKCTFSVKNSLVSSYHPRDWFKSTLPLLLIGAAGILNQRMPIIVGGLILKIESVGVLNISISIAALVSFVAQAFYMPLAPLITHLLAVNNKKKLRILMTRSARLSAVGSFLATISLVLLARPTLSLFGGTFSMAQAPLIILASGHAFSSLLGFPTTILIMSGHEATVAKAVLAMAFVNIVLVISLGSLWGMMGCSVAMVTSWIIMKLLLSYWAWKKTEIDPTIIGRG